MLSMIFSGLARHMRAIRFLPRGLIAITPPLYRNAERSAKIKPQTQQRWEVELLSQLPKFLRVICFILKLLKRRGLEDR